MIAGAFGFVVSANDQRKGHRKQVEEKVKDAIDEL
jgi:hypothetical protein